MVVVTVVPRFTQGVFAHYPDPYALLGVPVGAGQDQINRSFRRVAKALRSGFVGGSEESEQARVVFIKVVTPARTLLTRAVDKAEHDANLNLTIKRLLERWGQNALMPSTTEALWLTQVAELESEYFRLVEDLSQDLYQPLDQLEEQIHQVSQLNLAYLLLKHGGKVPRPPAQSRPKQSSAAAPPTPPPAQAQTPPPSQPDPQTASSPSFRSVPTPPTPQPLPADRQRQAQQLYQEAQSWSQRHHLRKAIQLLTQAIAQVPDSPTYYLERARLLRRLNDLDLARADYDHVIQLEPHNTEALQGLRDILSSSLSQPLHRNSRPTPPPTPEDPGKQEARQHYQEAVALLKEKEYRRAIRLLNRAINKDPANITLLLERARALRWIDELEMARVDYDQVVQYDPHNAEALQGLRDVLLQSARATVPGANELPTGPDPLAKQKEEGQLRHQQALRMIERAQFREAIQYLTIAIDRDPQNVEYYLERARTQRQLKNKGMAYADYKRVVQIDPTNIEAQRGLKETKPPTQPDQKTPSPPGRESKSQIERILFSDIGHLLPHQKGSAAAPQEREPKSQLERILFSDLSELMAKKKPTDPEADPQVDPLGQSDDPPTQPTDPRKGS